MVCWIKRCHLHACYITAFHRHAYSSDASLDHRCMYVLPDFLPSHGVIIDMYLYYSQQSNCKRLVLTNNALLSLEILITSPNQIKPIPLENSISLPGNPSSHRGLTALAQLGNISSGITTAPNVPYLEHPCPSYSAICPYFCPVKEIAHHVPLQSLMTSPLSTQPCPISLLCLTLS